MRDEACEEARGAAGVVVVGCGSGVVGAIEGAVGVDGAAFHLNGGMWLVYVGEGEGERVCVGGMDEEREE